MTSVDRAALEDETWARLLAVWREKGLPQALRLTLGQAQLINAKMHRAADGSYSPMHVPRAGERALLFDRPVEWVDNEADSILSESDGADARLDLEMVEERPPVQTITLEYRRRACETCGHSEISHFSLPLGARAHICRRERGFVSITWPEER